MENHTGALEGQTLLGTVARDGSGLRCMSVASTLQDVYSGVAKEVQRIAEQDARRARWRVGPFWAL